MDSDEVWIMSLVIAVTLAGIALILWVAMSYDTNRYEAFIEHCQKTQTREDCDFVGRLHPISDDKKELVLMKMEEIRNGR